MLDIPTYFKSLPQFRSQPVPHLVLPEPHAAFCLTPFVKADMVDFRRLVTSPHCVPFFGPAGPDDPLLDKHTAWSENWFLTETAFPFHVIRLVQDVAKWDPADSQTRPPMLGTIGFQRDAYGHSNLPDTDRLAAVADNTAKPANDADWLMNMVLLDAKYTGRGMMKAIITFCLENWFVPSIQTRPGQLVSTWEIENVASHRLHLALGFQIIGRMPDNGKKGAIRYIAAIWAPDGTADKSQTRYLCLPDFDGA